MTVPLLFITRTLFIEMFYRLRGLKYLLLHEVCDIVFHDIVSLLR